MLAARDQENLAYTHQNAAAAKPLNQGLAPKTPGNNTFNQNLKGRLTGKTGGKGDENATFGRKTGKQVKNDFVTPLAPRDRAPLGAKTTNAKAKSFQTPAPLTVKPTPGQKTTLRGNTSARRPKLKIHQQSEPVPESETILKETPAEDSDSSVPSIEHCPPKIEELPDISSDDEGFRSDESFSMFKPENILRGWDTWYDGPVGEDGLTTKARERKKQDERDEAFIDELDRKRTRETLRMYEEQDREKEHKNRVPKEQPVTETRNAGTIKSRDAARALSGPSFAAPTAAARAKASDPKSTTTGVATARSKKPAPLPAARGNASTAASRSTIGYAKGRKVSSSLHGNTKSKANVKSDQTKDDDIAQEDKAERELLDRLLDKEQAELDGCLRSREHV